jgi:hypothetical protein
MRLKVYFHLPPDEHNIFSVRVTSSQPPIHKFSKAAVATDGRGRPKSGPNLVRNL